MKKVLLFVLAGALLAACSPKVSSNLARTYTPLGDDVDVAVLEVGVPVPEDAELIGDIKIGDTGFTATKNGTFEDILALAKAQARAAGGNVISLTEHRWPDGSSTIHRIKANILRVADISGLPTHPVQPKHPEHPDYAVIYFYRLSGIGPLVTYNAHVGETSVYRAKVKSAAEVKVYEAGPVEIWGRTETKSSFPLNIQLGEEYYVRCSVTMGLFVGEPKLELMPEEVGYAEYMAASSTQSQK